MEFNSSSESSSSTASFAPSRLPMIGNEGWRRHGEERRRELLRKDKAEGGTSFFINRKCHVQKYFQIADRVLSQFRNMYQSRKNMEEIYVMGNRLIAFLSVALPKHPQYHSITDEISALRDKSLNDLDWIRKRLDVIKLRIDEEQLNHFIMKDLEANKKAQMQREDDDTKPTLSMSSSSAIDISFESDDLSHPAQDDAHWESFTGWSLEASDDDMELRSLWKDTTTTKDVSFDSHEVMDISSLSLFASQDDLIDDPGDILDVQSEPSDDEAESGEDTFDISVDRTASFRFCSDEEIDSTFLKAVAGEDVRYETDSEAVDSWAQDSIASVRSPAASLHVSASYNDDEDDDERFALDDILNRVQIASSPMRTSPVKNKRLGIQGSYGKDPQVTAMYGDHSPFDEKSTPSPAKSYERLGIRSYPSPDQENLFPGGTPKMAPADYVTFEMQGITPRRRVEESASRRSAYAYSDQHISDTSMYMSDDSDSDEEVVKSSGEIVQKYVYPRHRSH